MELASQAQEEDHFSVRFLTGRVQATSAAPHPNIWAAKHTLAQRLTDASTAVIFLFALVRWIASWEANCSGCLRVTTLRASRGTHQQSTQQDATLAQKLASAPR